MEGGGEQGRCRGRKDGTWAAPGDWRMLVLLRSACFLLAWEAWLLGFAGGLPTGMSQEGACEVILSCAMTNDLLPSSASAYASGFAGSETLVCSQELEYLRTNIEMIALGCGSD